MKTYFFVGMLCMGLISFVGVAASDDQGAQNSVTERVLKRVRRHPVLAAAGVAATTIGAVVTLDQVMAYVAPEQRRQFYAWVNGMTGGRLWTTPAVETDREMAVFRDYNLTADHRNQTQNAEELSSLNFENEGILLIGDYRVLDYRGLDYRVRVGLLRNNNLFFIMMEQVPESSRNILITELSDSENSESSAHTNLDSDPNFSNSDAE